MLKDNKKYRFKRERIFISGTCILNICQVRGCSIPGVIRVGIINPATALEAEIRNCSSTNYIVGLPREHVQLLKFLFLLSLIVILTVRKKPVAKKRKFLT